MRAKNVFHCSVGAFALYLAQRFEITKEFDDYEVEDFLDNERWFKVKLLVDAFTDDTTKEMSGDGYSKAAGKVTRSLGIASKKFMHLGRNLGPKLLELKEVSPEDIKQLGNWNPSMQEKHYSTKIPMVPIRAAAGFDVADGMHYNPRTILDPPVSLVMQTPFAFAMNLIDYVKCEIEEGAEKYTAYHFLLLMHDLAVILLQDAAAMLVLDPDRKEHPLFDLQVFKSLEFKVREREERKDKIYY